MTAICSRCHRELTDPTSIKAGIGPICAAKLAAEQGHDENTEPYDVFLPNPQFTDQIVFQRGADGTIYTNVHHLIRHHSPTGFEFGYPGSGPSDLALNILENMLNARGHNGNRVKTWDENGAWDIAWSLHQDFKWEFLVDVPRQGAAIDYAVANAWLNNRLANL